MRKIQRANSGTTEQLRLETRMMGASPSFIAEPSLPSADKVESENGISAEVCSLPQIRVRAFQLLSLV
jgi:hypothetical protein